MLLGVLVEAVKTVTLIERENLDAEVARKAPWQFPEAVNSPGVRQSRPERETASEAQGVPHKLRKTYPKTKQK